MDFFFLLTIIRLFFFVLFSFILRNRRVWATTSHNHLDGGDKNYLLKFGKAILKIEGAAADKTTIRNKRK